MAKVSVKDKLVLTGTETIYGLAIGMADQLYAITLPESQYLE